MININEFALEILKGTSLSQKLLRPDQDLDFSAKDLFFTINKPARSEKIKLGGQAKFPHQSALRLSSERARAIHFFANHELLAIEMMAYFILTLKESTLDNQILRRRVYETLRDEQKHLELYVSRINSLGVEFGDFPLNDFLWRQTVFFTDPQKYFAIMALTFECANLDFSKYYSELFLNYGDQESSKILEIVYNDEIAHVALGVSYLEKGRNNLALWDYYRQLLPDRLGPARSKGNQFDEYARSKAGLDKQFIETQKLFVDPYKTINRKSWKTKDDDIYSKS